MRVWAFLLLTAAALAFQTAVAPRCAIGPARVDAMLVLTILLAMHAKRPFSYACGALVGLGVSMVSAEPLGLFVLVYGLAGAAVAIVRDLLFIYHVAVQFAVAGCAAVILHAGWLAYRLVFFPTTTAGMATEMWSIVGTSLVTAAVTPIASVMLRPFSAWLGLMPARYHARGWDASRRG